MSDNLVIELDELLSDSIVKRITNNNGPELLERINYQPTRCDVFYKSFTVLLDYPNVKFNIHREAKKKLPQTNNNKLKAIVGENNPSQEVIANWKKKRNVGIVFSGGPAPGGHNVIAGIFDAIKSANPDSKVYGFLDGPDGIIENESIEITREMVDKYRNLGGFGMIKTSRTKIDNTKKIASSKQTCKEMGLSALVVVGGDDSNTNAAFLAEELYQQGVQVIGVPKTIDGDIQVRDGEGNLLCAISFGFHTAARACAKEISNLCTDCSSDVKYWHICKVMGRAASHLALEVALQTHANMTLIGEDMSEYIDYRRIENAKKRNEVDYTAYGMTLRHLSRVVCDGIVRRAANGKNYGVIVIPEGILEFINEIQSFILKLNTILAEYNRTRDTEFHSDFTTLNEKLDYLRRLARMAREENTFSIWNTRDDDLFSEIPSFFQEGLLMERDSHGNFQFSQVKTDEVIMGLVKDYLNILEERGIYKIGIKKTYYEKVMQKGGLEPQTYGPTLFKNYPDADFLIMKQNIISSKTLKQTLTKSGILSQDADVPGPILSLYKKSVPQFKTQTHFYGYDGRGNDPTRFDCTYAYNLGMTTFSLICGGATGVLAGIRNLELEFPKWEPIGIPIAPLMHLEERKGKLELVLEKSIVDTESNAFRVVKAMREKWLAAAPTEDAYRRPGPIRFTGKSEEDRPITLVLNAIGKIDNFEKPG